MSGGCGGWVEVKIVERERESGGDDFNCYNKINMFWQFNGQVHKKHDIHSIIM